MTDKKPVRTSPRDLPAADREMHVMRKCRMALDILDTPQARERVVAWLGAVFTREVPPPPQKPHPNQLGLLETCRSRGRLSDQAGGASQAILG